MVDVLATAVVELEADIVKFLKQFDRGMRDVGRDANRSAREVDRAFQRVAGELADVFDEVGDDVKRQLSTLDKSVDELGRDIGRSSADASRDVVTDWRRATGDVERLFAELPEAARRSGDETQREFARTQRTLRSLAERPLAFDVRLHADAAALAAQVRRSLDAAGRDIQRAVDDNVSVAFKQTGKTKTTAEDAGAAVGDSLLQGIGRSLRALPAQLEGALIAGVTALAVSTAPVLGLALGGAVVSAFGAGLAGLGIAVAARAPEVRDAFALLADHVNRELTRAAKPFERTLVLIASDARQTFDVLVKEFERVTPALSFAVSDFADDLGHAVERLAPAIKPLSDAFIRILDEIGPRLPEVFTGISNSLISLADKVGRNAEGFARVVTGLVDLIRVGLDFLGWLISVGEGIVELGQTIEDWSRRAHAAVTGFFAAFIAAAVGALKPIGAGFEQLWSAAVSVTEWAWGVITSVVQVGVSAVRAVVGGLESVVGFVSGVFRRAADGVRNGFNDAVEFVRGVPDRILSALGSVGSLLYQSGRDLLQGMINGIRDMIGSLASQAASAARSALDAAKSALGISSPSKVMMLVGEQFGQGFVDGIGAMVYDAQAVAAHLASQTAGELGADFGVGTLNRFTARGHGTPAFAGSINVTSAPEVQVFVGNEEFRAYTAEVASEVVADHDRRLKRSLNMGARRTV